MALCDRNFGVGGDGVIFVLPGDGVAGVDASGDYTMRIYNSDGTEPEMCGDGIMSAIDFYMTVGKTVGKGGEDRVVITFNGKFLKHIEQNAADNTAPSVREP